MTGELLGFLALLVAVALASFIAGYRSARAYLTSAEAVSTVSNAAIEKANDFAAALDRNEKSLAELKDAVQASSERSAERSRGVEESLLALFQGFERAGLARSPRAPGRQVGEPEAS